MIPTPVSKQVVGEIHIQAWLTDVLSGSNSHQKPKENRKEIYSEEDEPLRPVSIDDEERKKKILRERLGIEEETKTPMTLPAHKLYDPFQQQT
jgi:hypothetical protein